MQCFSIGEEERGRERQRALVVWCGWRARKQQEILVYFSLSNFPKRSFCNFKTMHAQSSLIIRLQIQNSSGIRRKQMPSVVLPCSCDSCTVASTRLRGLNEPAWALIESNQSANCTPGRGGCRIRFWLMMAGCRHQVSSACAVPCILLAWWA